MHNMFRREINQPVYKAILLMLLVPLIRLSNPSLSYAHGTETSGSTSEGSVSASGSNEVINEWAGIPVDVWAISGMVVTAMLALLYILRFAPFSPMAKRPYRKGYRKGWIAATLMSLVFTVVMAWSSSVATQPSEPIPFNHVHGLGFSPDGQELYVPIHQGIISNHHGVWEQKGGEAHDYMGFVVTEDGFYSSGHPAEGSEWPNPLGWVRAGAPDQPLQSLSLKGESDFHLTTVGYRTKVAYVGNMESNSLMTNTGIYRSVDGKSWDAVPMQGIQGNLIGIAAHPEESLVVVASSDRGYWLSEDGGQTFQAIATTLVDNQVKPGGVFFSPHGDLWMTLLNSNGQAELYRWRYKEDQGTKLYTPPNVMVEISYVAQHPTRQETMAFATAELDIYYSTDRGDNWLKIATKGLTIDGEVELEPLQTAQPANEEQGEHAHD